MPFNRRRYIEGVLEAVDYIGEEEDSCPNCNVNTREWKLPASFDKPPSGYDVDEPDPDWCPECWAEWVSEIWEALVSCPRSSATFSTVVGEVESASRARFRRENS